VTREARSTISGEQAFRFKHVLIRDVAYSGVSKGARAELHRRFAAWLHDRGADELLEIRAYHLDHACALLAELDGEAPPELAAEAAEALYEAGKRALAREANRSGRNLLVRAVELEPTLERRYQAARAALRLTDLPAVSLEMESVRSLAAEAGDTRLEGRASTALAEVALESNADVPRARELGNKALELLPEDDEIGRYQALGVLSQAGWWEGDLASVERHARAALEIACKLGRKDWESGSTVELASVFRARLEDDRADELLARAAEFADESGSFVARGWAAGKRGESHVYRGELDEAEEAFIRAHDLFAEAGATTADARALTLLARVHRSKGDLPGAEKLLRDAAAMLKPIEDRGTLVETQRTLAQVLLEEGKVEEAERYALESRETVGARDMASRASTRMALGLVRAAQGRDEDAESLLVEAVEILAETDYRRHEVELLMTIADFLRSRGRDADAAVYEARAAELAPVSAARIA
jgi:ATP/maltotriose-dependent transcriptional regulator MalT